VDDALYCGWRSINVLRAGRMCSQSVELAGIGAAAACGTAIDARIGPQTSPPAQADRSGSKMAPGSGSAGSSASSQGMTSTKPKSPTAPRNTGNGTGAAPAAGTPKSEAPRPATSSPPTAAPPAAPTAAKASPALPAVASLDLTSLEQRLKDTRAIGVFTKLSLKNQVDDLLSQFRAFHNRKSATPLSELRQRYDLLLMKVLSLLQDGDPPLASAISSSREAIWGILSDPQKFAKL
jgi:hypothetical protein